MRSARIYPSCSTVCFALASLYSVPMEDRRQDDPDRWAHVLLKTPLIESAIKKRPEVRHKFLDDTATVLT